MLHCPWVCWPILDQPSIFTPPHICWRASRGQDLSAICQGGTTFYSGYCPPTRPPHCLNWTPDSSGSGIQTKIMLSPSVQLQHYKGLFNGFHIAPSVLTLKQPAPNRRMIETVWFSCVFQLMSSQVILNTSKFMGCIKNAGQTQSQICGWEGWCSEYAMGWDGSPSCFMNLKWNEIKSN